MVKLTTKIVKSTDLWSKINLCTRSLILRKKNSQCGFCLYELFKNFWSSTPSTVSGGDIRGYRARSLLMAKILFKNENSKDKNRRRYFQIYQGDIGSPTSKSSWADVFHLICQQKIGNFWLRPCRRFYETISSCQRFSGLYENSVGSERLVQEKFIVR
jgi:hypothetical protein